MSIQKEIREELDSLVRQINIALGQGIRIEFNLQKDPTGILSVASYECWTRMPDEGARTQ
jgi:hypothetical protein